LPFLPAGCILLKIWILILFFVQVEETDELNFKLLSAVSTGTPPSPPFTADNKCPQSWSGANALLYRTRGYAPAGLGNVADGALLGSFTVGG